jgi:phenylacetate-CoA ligase
MATPPGDRAPAAPSKAAHPVTNTTNLGAPLTLLRSSVPGVTLVGIPAPDAAIVAAVLLQLLTIEKLPKPRLETLQMTQLGALVRHGWTHAPFWRARLEQAGWTPSMPVDRGLLSRLPPLTRLDVQTHVNEMRVKKLPEGFGRTALFRTSGSTGRPVEVYSSALNHTVYDAQTYRDHLWHGRNLKGTLGVLRTRRKDSRQPAWSGIARALSIGGTGPCLVRGSDGKDFASHLDWLVAEKPDYLNINPTLAAALARLHLERGYPRLAIQQIMSTGGTVTDEARALCREAWGAEFTDRYSSEEIGWLAFQCPHHIHYHVAETVLVEIVDSAGRPCKPGETGRVLVTPLLSFAMPLLRYEIGDMAVPGEACDCGRTLPVISRIMGRQFNFAVLPDGRWRVGMLQAKDWVDVAPIKDFRVRQTALDKLEAELVLPRPLTAEDVARATAMLRAFFGYDFGVSVMQVPAIDWGPTDKREGFMRLRHVGTDMPF